MKINTLCKFIHPDLNNKEKYPYPFEHEDIFVYLGLIRKMKGHGIFVHCKTNKVYTGYHMDGFEELTEQLI